MSDNRATRVQNIGRILAPDGNTLLKMWSVLVPEGERGLFQHYHLCFEISCVIKGSGLYEVRGTQYPMCPGDMFVFSGNEQHCITRVDAGGLEILTMQFEPRYLWGHATDSLSEQNIGFCAYHSRRFENRIPSERASHIYSLFENIRRELETQKPEYGLAVKSYLNLIVIRLIRAFGYAEHDMTFSLQKMRSVGRVVNYIDQNLSAKLTLEELARIAGISPNYFSTFFREVSGITLWDYIRTRRIEKAIRLIIEENGTRNIGEIAAMCGFNSTANFNRAFRSVTGMTPTKYRMSDDRF